MDLDVRQFAVEAHAGQMYGNRPYTCHLDEVAGVLREFGYDDPTHQEGAYVHDVPEDTEVTGIGMLQAGISEEVVAVALFCMDEPGHNRKTRKARTFARMEAQLSSYLKNPETYRTVPAGIRVKVGDRISNLRASIRGNQHGLLKMYRREGEAFRNALYHPGICDAMWAEYDRLIAA